MPTFLCLLRFLSFLSCTLVIKINKMTRKWKQLLESPSGSSYNRRRDTLEEMGKFDASGTVSLLVVAIYKRYFSENDAHWNWLDNRHLILLLIIPSSKISWTVSEMIWIQRKSLQTGTFQVYNGKMVSKLLKIASPILIVLFCLFTVCIIPRIRSMMSKWIDQTVAGVQDPADGHRRRTDGYRRTLFLFWG